MDQISVPSNNYAHLPDELLEQILNSVPNTVDKMNKLFDIQDEPIQKGIKYLRDNNFIHKLSESNSIDSVIAVDGSNIVDKLSGSDIILSCALGVEGLTEDKSKDWGVDNNQYMHWQTVLPHGEANTRLAQGAMFLMELSVLASAKHNIRIMDGTHFTPILKINSMLNAKDDHADESYVAALKDFLKEKFQKIIPDIPDMLKGALLNDNIIALNKYSSSRDVIDSFISSYGISIDDKTFFSLSMVEGEYFIPMSVGQSQNERRKIWDDLHIKCNLDLDSEIGMTGVEIRDKLNSDLESIINCISTKGGKESELYFTYYKPYQEGPAYRIEIQKGLVKDQLRFERFLSSLKAQIIFPEIREPYPQYLVDLMAKSISIGMTAIKEAVKLSPDLKIDKGRFDLLNSYRT